MAHDADAQLLFRKTGRQFRVDYLTCVIRDVEQWLVKAGKPRDAWKTIAVHFDGTASPTIGYDHRTRLALGKRDYRIVREHGRRVGVEELQPYWRAKVAAIAHAALDHIDDPAVMFVVGKEVQQYHLGDVFPVVRRLAIGRAQSKRGKAGGLKGRGIGKRAHTNLIRTASEYAGSPETVQVVAALAADWEAIRDMLERSGLSCPITDVRVRAQARTVTFEYEDRPPATLPYVEIARTLRRTK